MAQQFPCGGAFAKFGDPLGLSSAVGCKPPLVQLLPSDGESVGQATLRDLEYGIVKLNVLRRLKQATWLPIGSGLRR